MTVRFGDLLEKASRVYGDDPAVTAEGRTKSWREVHARCRNVAAGLERLGLKPGDRVAYLGFNSDALFECYFAPSLAGCEAVVMNYRWSARECAAALRECTPKALIFDAAHADLAGQAVAEVARPLHMIEVGPLPRTSSIAYEELATRKGTPTARGSCDDDTLIIYFTGGTTGRSKGVMLSHWNLFANAMGAPHIMGNERNSAQMVVGPMFHLAPGSRIF
jgi:acyl-CoA synthetase (AMP-forming)/AMP-acid ligase II